MIIVCKWSALGNQSQATFNTIQEMTAHEMYNHFNYINMDKCGLTEMPLFLPPNLRILSFNENKIFSLPDLPPTLHSLFGINNRISKFPEIAHCIELEDINLSGNDIVELDTFIPHNVRTIDIDFNRLRIINYNLISPETKISAAYNFMKQPPPPTHIANIRFDHNDIDDKTYTRIVPDAVLPHNHINALIPFEGPFRAANQPRFYAAVNTLVPQVNRITGTDGQSVHQTSIQQSANKSLIYVLEYVPKNPIQINFVDKVEEAYYNARIRKSKIRKGISCLSKSLARRAIFPPPIKKWCEANDIHSQFGVSYKSLLKQVWAIIQDHEHRIAMEEILFQEMDDSRYVCFTGRFTRTINALNGFVEQVQIGINSREQMGNQIAMVVKKTKERLGANFHEEATKEVKKILIEFEIPEYEQGAWLDAID